MINKYHNQIFRNDKNPYNPLENFLFCHEILGDGNLVTDWWDMTIKTCRTSDKIKL